MAITFPLSMPLVTIGGSVHGLRSFAMMPNAARGRNLNPYKFSEQIYRYEGARWNIEATYVPLKAENAKAVIAFLLKLDFGVGTFLCGDLNMSSPLGIIGGTPLVNGGSQVGETLVTDGWNSGDTFKAGDYFQIGNNLYMNLTDVVADGGGNATLDIFPQLRSSPANNAPLILTSPKGLFRLADSNVSWSTTEEGIYDISFSAVEVL